MLIYTHSLDYKAKNRLIASVSDITLIDTLIIFETLANVNIFLKGGIGLFSYRKYAELRDFKNVTDYEVSKNTGVPTSTLSNWKAGRYSPKADKISKISEYLGKPIEYFLK